MALRTYMYTRYVVCIALVLEPSLYFLFTYFLAGGMFTSNGSVNATVTMYDSSFQCNSAGVYGDDFDAMMIVKSVW